MRRKKSLTWYFHANGVQWIHLGLRPGQNYVWKPRCECNHLHTVVDNSVKTDNVMSEHSNEKRTYTSREKSYWIKQRHLIIQTDVNWLQWFWKILDSHRQRWKSSFTCNRLPNFCVHCHLRRPNFQSRELFFELSIWRLKRWRCWVEDLLGIEEKESVWD